MVVETNLGLTATSMLTEGTTTSLTTISIHEDNGTTNARMATSGTGRTNKGTALSMLAILQTTSMHLHLALDQVTCLRIS